MERRGQHSILNARFFPSFLLCGYSGKKRTAQHSQCLILSFLFTVWLQWEEEGNTAFSMLDSFLPFYCVVTVGRRGQHSILNAWFFPSFLLCGYSGKKRTAQHSQCLIPSFLFTVWLQWEEEGNTAFSMLDSFLPFYCVVRLGINFQC